MSAKQIIESNYGKLTKTERYIADYILINPEDVLSQTLSRLSRIIGVGEATFVRFLMKCDFKSIHELKFSIVRDIEQSRNNSQNDFVSQLFESAENSLKSTNDLLDRKLIKRAVDEILKAEKLYIFGIGHSGLAAEIFAYRFMRAGIVCKAVTDIHFQKIQASLCTEKDLIISILRSGQSIDLYKSLELAKMKRVKIISIVGYLKSNIAEISDLVFYSGADPINMRCLGAGIDSIITQLLLVDVLIAEFIGRDQEKNRELAISLTGILAEGKFNTKQKNTNLKIN